MKKSALLSYKFIASLLLLASIACSGDKSVDPIDDPVATTIAANSSTSLTGLVGAVVSPAPSILVRDQNGAPMAGVAVTFAVVTGGGSVSGASVATDASGIATVGSWTLGAVAGPNTLSAAVGTLTPVTFTATATAVAPPPSACDVRTAHALGTTTPAALATTDCRLSFGTYVDFFSTTLGQANMYLFRQTAGFDTYLFLAGADGFVIAENDDEIPTSTNSAIKALLPAGTYLLAASSYDAGVTGSYSISSSTAPSSITGCDSVFVVKSVSTTQSIEPSDCLKTTPPAAPIFGDVYVIFLRAGQSITLTMASIQVDAFLQIVNDSGAQVASNDNRDASTKDAELTYTAPTGGYYTINAKTGVTSQTGNYTLTIQ